MKIKVSEFRVPEGGEVNLKKWPTRVKDYYKSKEHYQEMLADSIERMSKLQNVMYADNRYALLIVFQAMDAGGKDSAIKHVMSGLNPQGCQVYSFKYPTPEDLDHDFLWRTTSRLPERGRIGIFNRSHYEEVLVVRVHPEILERQRIPELPEDPDRIWKGRFRSIVELEKHLYRNGTRIVKFYLHISKEEQRKRFLSRIDDPEKNWKFSVDDVEERKYWKQYMRAYEECIAKTSIDEAPWYIVPADDKENARLIISQVLLGTLQKLDLRYPEVGEEKKKALGEIRKHLTGE